MIVKSSFLAVGFWVVIGLASAAAQGTDLRSNSDAQQVIDNQFNAFRARQHEEAFSYAAPALKKLFGTTDRFIGMVKSGYGAIYAARNWSFGRSRMDSGTLYQEVLLTGPKGGNWVALYALRQQEDGSWKITSVQIRKAVAQTT